MTRQKWTSEDGSIHYELLTTQYLTEAYEVVRATLFTSGNVSKAIGIPRDPQALTEIDQLAQATAKDGVSVIAIDTKKDKVVGVAFNKILTQTETFYEDLAKSFKNFRSRQVMDFIISSESICNLFEHCQVDCVMEILLLGTVPECRKQGIAKKLCEVSLEIAQNLLDGINVKQSIDGTEMSLEPRPKAVTAIFTSFISQKIGQQLGFKTAAERSHKTMKLLGKTMENLAEVDTLKTCVAYKKLVKN